MALGLWGRNRHVGSVYGSGDPPTLWLALMSEAPSDLASGSDLDEPTHASYARIEVPNDNSSDGFFEPADGEVVNASDLVFPEATGNWGTVRFWAFATDEAAGEILVWGFLGARFVYEGRRLRIPSGALVIGARGTEAIQPSEWADEEVE